MSMSLARSARHRRVGSRRLTLLSDTRGTAMAETAIMLPVLILIWGGILYAFTLGTAIVEMNVRIRADSWSYAYEGCENQPTGTNFSEDSFNGETGDTSIPIFGSIMRFLFTEHFGQREGERTAPTLLGGYTNHYSTQHLWMCNERIEDWDVVNFISRIFI